MLALWNSLPLREETAVAISDPREAINYALEHASEEDAIFIGGSNYLVGDAISLFAH
jgi:folylpolyglutamate synthase/dihydropteroate synthase